jgi:NADPH-dependent 2,4-dienoyl-CoA reductase/sulfur reductase-like enzyme
MTRFELVIAGGGLTAARAIKSYREAGGSGQIALLSKESDLPYHRPALSKRYLRGETTDAPFAEDEAFYREHDVEVVLETTATAVDASSRIVATDTGPFHYKKLLIATGARPRRLTCQAQNSKASTRCAHCATRKRFARRQVPPNTRSWSAVASSAWR